MSASIERVVRVVITKGTRQVSVQGFGVACIFGPSNRFMDPIRYYTDPSDMLADGFLTSDPEYIDAVEICSQNPRPAQFAVSHFTTPIKQVDTITPTAVNATLYKVTIGATDYSYTSDADATVAEIVAGLIALINGDANAVVIATGTTTLILTAKVAGAGFDTSINASPNMVLVHTTANHSIVDDIASLQQIDDSWYGVLVTSRNSDDIKQVAAYIETQKKLYIASSSESGITTTSTTDLASYLKGKNYERTALIRLGDPSTAPDAAWVGRMFPTTPGSSNWKFKTLIGITADNLTNTAINNAQGKNANTYITIGGVDITTEGVVSSGEYIDVTVFIDWLVANIESAVYSVFVNNDKVPYTNKGIAQVENAIRGVLQQGQDNGGLAAGWTVTVPDVADVSSQDKAARVLNNVRFDATLAGAINKVNIQGFVSV
jgi:hypothetical protein